MSRKLEIAFWKQCRFEYKSPVWITFHEYHWDSLYNSNVFGTRFPTSRNCSWCNGILNISKTGNRTPKTLWIHSGFTGVIYFLHGISPDSPFVYNVSRTRFSTSMNPSKPNGVLNILQTGNRVLKIVDLNTNRSSESLSSRIPLKFPL